MKQWNEYESTLIKGARSMKVFIDDEEVIFFATMNQGATFTREEAVDVLKDLIKVLEE